MFRPAIFVAGAVLALAGGCKGSTAMSKITREPSANRDPGPQRGLDAELTPTRVSRDRVELALDLESHLEGASRARWAVEIVDDAGVAVQKPVLETPIALTRNVRHRALITTPASLADGFYVVRVTAVAKAGAASDASVLERYFEIRGGDVTPIDSEDYQLRSRARMGGVL